MEEFIQKIAKEAGKAILEQYGKIGSKYYKTDPTDVVTEADLIANRIISSAIKEKYPDHGIISEEEKEHAQTAEYVWIVDPLDGTRNFSTQTPIFATMIALAKKGEIILAVIYDPYNDWLYFAKKSQGTRKNGQIVKCSKTREMNHSFGSGVGNFIPVRIPFLKSLIKIATKEGHFHASGFISAAHNAFYVADGRRDWYYSAGGGLWDYTATYLILKEAGCVVTNDKGEPWSIKDRSIVAANKYLYPKFIKIVKGDFK